MKPGLRRPIKYAPKDAWNEYDLMYLAGYLDGEGCFWIGQHSKIGVSCSNTHRPTVEWLHKTFGGSMRRNTRKRKPHHRPMYSWQVVSRDAAEVCGAVAVYLREKAPQALLLLAMRAQMQKTGSRPLRIPQHLKEERARLTHIMKGMKHVSW